MRKISDERVGRQSRIVNGVNWEELSSAQRNALLIADSYPVFPCDPISKRPLTKKGFKDASQDASQVVGWWRKYPEALIGVPMGRASGLVAVDVDPDGREWYRTHRGRLGAHRLHGTRRGKHLLYRMNGQAIHNSAGEVADGVDVRGEGGYIIWWPAHGGVAVGEPGEIPEWLERKLTQGGTPRKLERGAEPTDSRDERKFGEGERSDALSRRAFYYHRMGMSTKEVGAALLKYDLEHCVPPYQQTDGKHKVLYIARKKAHLKTDESEKSEKEHGEVLVSCARNVRPRKWVWEGHIEQGVYHLLGGVPGVNKTCTVLSFAATITSGGLWPDGTRFEKPANVVMWSGEDEIETTLRPRFLVCGGDWERMHFVSGVQVNGKKRRFSPARDMEALIQVCQEIGDVRLVIIDSISNAIVKDSHNDSEVRQQLEPLLDFIERTGAALFGISHFTKGSRGADPLERIMGSRAMGAVPRGTYACTKILDENSKDTGNRVFTMLKTQFAPEDHGFEYRVEDVAVPGRPQVRGLKLVWGKRVNGSAAQIIHEAEGNGDGTSKLGEAKKVLQTLLAKRSVNNYELSEAIGKAGISRATYRRARDDLGLVSTRVGRNAFRWSLPDNDTENAAD
jgi:putative DNA primase/helicase